MAWESIQNRSAQFVVDWSVVRRLVRSFWLAKTQYDDAVEIKISDSSWYNPMSWSLPDVSHIEVNWPKVKSYADAMTDSDMGRFKGRAAYDAAGVAREIEQQIDDAAWYKENFLDWMAAVQTENVGSIDKAVKDYSADIQIAKFMRDTSADGIMVGASILTGGTAIAAMAGGSILKGSFKFQDTGSVGAASMEAIGSFAFASVKLGRTFSFKEEMVLTIVESAWKSGTELVGGASVRDAALSGALKLTGPSISRIFKTGPAKTLFDMVPVPIMVQVKDLPTEKMWVDKSAEISARLAAKFVQRQGVEKLGKQSIQSLLDNSPVSPGSSSSDAARQRRSAILDEATLTNQWLLKFAFVNMANGIGRGW